LAVFGLNLFYATIFGFFSMHFNFVTAILGGCMETTCIFVTGPKNEPIHKVLIMLNDKRFSA
jgi:hypothetical protein